MEPMNHFTPSFAVISIKALLEVRLSELAFDLDITVFESDILFGVVLHSQLVSGEGRVVESCVAGRGCFRNLTCSVLTTTYIILRCRWRATILSPGFWVHSFSKMICRWQCSGLDRTETA